mmetsp:Transcript_172/g.430  ORF Transcript_172/g.430 Transcript_172/m.430 type:complete len:245 (+) Transcript_172:1487-2221(+)
MRLVTASLISANVRPAAAPQQRYSRSAACLADNRRLAQRTTSRLHDAAERALGLSSSPCSSASTYSTRSMGTSSSSTTARARNRLMAWSPSSGWSILRSCAALTRLAKPSLKEACCTTGPPSSFDALASPRCQRSFDTASRSQSRWSSATDTAFFTNSACACQAGRFGSSASSSATRLIASSTSRLVMYSSRMSLLLCFAALTDPFSAAALVSSLRAAPVASGGTAYDALLPFSITPFSPFSMW